MTNTSVQVFNSEDFGSVRALTINSEPGFVAPYARMTRKGLDWCLNHYCAAHIVA